MRVIFVPDPDETSTTSGSCVASAARDCTFPAIIPTILAVNFSYHFSTIKSSHYEISEHQPQKISIGLCSSRIAYTRIRPSAGRTHYRKDRQSGRSGTVRKLCRRQRQQHRISPVI